MKIIFLGVVFLFNSSLSFSQNSKQILGITEVAFVNKKDKGFASQINEILSGQFDHANRFILVERSKFDLIEKERELQKSEAFLDGLVISQGKSLGARYIVTSVVSHINSNNKYNSISKVYIYNFDIVISLKILDVETGELISALNMGKPTSNTTGWGANCNAMGTGTDYDSSIKNAMSNLSCGIKKWIDEAFPIEFLVLKIEDSKKDKAKTILVSGGKDKGILKGQTFNLFQKTVEDIDGEKIDRKKIIGECKVQLLEGEKLSICEVTSGEKEVFNLMERKIKIFGILK